MIALLGGTMVRRSSLLLLCLAACSKAPTDGVPADTDETGGGPSVPEDTFVPPVETDVEDTDDGSPIGPVEKCVVPTGPGLEGVCDLSVGAASAEPDPGADHTLFLQVNESGPGTGVAFNGDGFGHRAIAGFHGYDKVKLTDLGRLELVAKGLQPTFDLLLGLQVDLTCGTRELALLEVVLERVLDRVDEADGFTRYRLPHDAAIWTAAEALVDGDGVTVLEKTTATGVTPRTLLALLDTWPDACLRNTNGSFDDMPKNATVSGLTLSLGSRTTYGVGALWELNEVRVGDDVHLPKP